jgi:hypothetical protein
MISGYFVWWYGAGIVQAYTAVTAFISYIVDAFSLPTIMRTLFAPWKNDVLTARNVSLGDQLKIWEMNFASRIIGFLVRLVVIFVAAIILLLLVVGAGVGLALWIATPILVLLLPILGVGRMFV